MSAHPDTVYRWHPKVACRTLDGTAFILADSRMLSLNPVGSRIWDLLETGATIADLSATIAGEFETTREVAAADISHFIDDLLTRQLLVPQSSPGGSSPAEPHGNSGDNHVPSI